MAENNKSYRIRTKVGQEADTYLNVHLDQDYDSLEILSLKISDKDVYRLHNSNYGVIAGRVLANGNFGVPNAKISIFIAADQTNADLRQWELYPYASTSTRATNGIRYNLLPDESVKDCHKAVGTFPNKTYLLDNDAILEVFDTYYIYTTRTNASGDYLICGVPTGNQTLHMDLDLSDCGILSQRPRDFVYKGYTIEQFENPNQFKKDENLDGLSQIFSQNQPVYVQPFWGNAENGEEIGITRADIEISFKFEPTCVFMGSAISDNVSNGVGKKCVPTNQMGSMDELTAGEGTIEMIRKTPGGNVEEFSIKGNQLIDGNGVWCYQIPMNLDYMMTDEYGNMVPTDDPEKGIPTRARVRFRASLTDMENSSQNYYRAKYLIPNNPDIDDNRVDYNFGTYTNEESFRDLFWNGVYTVKSYIPRFQKSKRWRSERFTGIKSCNYYGNNNPMPYNNLRVKLPFMFTVLCIFVKLFIKIVSLVNRIIAGVIRIFIGVMDVITYIPRMIGKFFVAIRLLKGVGQSILDWADSMTAGFINKFIRKYGVHCTFIGDGLCPDLEGWYFAPGCASGIRINDVKRVLMENTLAAANGNGDNLEDLEMDNGDPMTSTEYTDETSVDVQNTSTSEEESVCLTVNVDYLVSCFEMNLAQEYRVIKFDFYNDWVNGVLYFPRWMRLIKRKKKYKFSLSGIKTYYKDKVLGCMNSENSNVKKSRYYTQQCNIGYERIPNEPWTTIKTSASCYPVPKNSKGKPLNIFPSKCHKKQGMGQSSIFGKKAGLVTEETTMLGQYVYYLKPCEWKDTDNGRKRTLLFATDIVLLGTLNDCDENGIPQAFKYLSNSSYIMPTNLALTTMDDDAYIYAPSGGTICSSTLSKGGRETVADGVTRITPSYQSTYSAYSQTELDQIEYGEYDDPIPVTEAAGINWNYSGPGQDDVEPGKYTSAAEMLKNLFGENPKQTFLYYPGGHFLGLSCVNSDTNIKSCVNLKRICEVGSTMSQRREELRGYDPVSGTPKYRYYVPTGLISNVDIDAASFRSMFATMNHNKLIATEISESTGYMKYGFRFLRPDGFDGSLANYVHMDNSPYNKMVGGYLTDESGFMRSNFGWDYPLDYDKHEVEYTGRRTVEDDIADYQMFRLGLNDFSDSEQRKRFLAYSSTNGYSMPQYENSFYFYFGLKDGSTALDEFKKQFFSECASNTIARTPSINVREVVVDDGETLVCKGKLIIDNMQPTYTITVVDNTDPTNVSSHDPITSEMDTINLEDYIGIYIGHEYTITVTDSIDQTVTKTFVYGSSAVKVNASTVHFRKKGNSRSTTPKTGGYIKMNDEVSILKQTYYISSGSIDFTFNLLSGDTWVDVTSEVSKTSYSGETGELWYLYYVPSVGTYEVFVNYNNNPISVYNTTLEDNTKIEMYVACDYLGYKSGYGLSGLTRQGWMDMPEKFLSASTKDAALLRHTFYRQTPNDNAGFNSYIYASGKNNLAIYGEAEAGGLTSAATFTDGVLYYQGDYDLYRGMTIEDDFSFIPTLYWNSGETTDNSIYRNAFYAMAYSDDGRAAADALTGITITGYTTVVTSGSIVFDIDFTGSVPELTYGTGCIVVFENGTMLFPTVVKDADNPSTLFMRAYSTYDIYPTNPTNKRELLEMASVYPTFFVPVCYKPFYGVVSAATWNVDRLVLGTGDNGETMPQKENLPLSYKVEGDIYNGLSYNGKFTSGSTSGIYETYLIFNNLGNFYEALTVNSSEDYKPMRKASFGRNSDSSGFTREVSEYDASAGVIQNISYAVKEGFATGYSDTVYTQRYSGGIDLFNLTDSCSIAGVFYENLRLKVIDASSGPTGPFGIYTSEGVVTNIKLYITKEALFEKSQEPLTVEDAGSTFCLGTYNQNAKYDVKGTTTPVSKNGSNYEYSITLDTGSKLKKTGNESAMSGDGISLAYKYTLKNSYKKNISAILNVMTNSALTSAVTLWTENVTGSVFSGSEGYNAVIAVYERPYTGSRNVMSVMKLYPLGSLDEMYPPSEGGVSPYLNVPDILTYQSNGTVTQINVTTNIPFKATITGSSSWLKLVINGTSTATTHNYDTSDPTVSVSLTENTGTTARSGYTVFESLEEGVSVSAKTAIVQMGQSTPPVSGGTGQNNG